MLFEIHVIVEKDRFRVCSVIRDTEEVIGRDTEILRQQADCFKVRLFALRLVAGHGRTLF